MSLTSSNPSPRDVRSIIKAAGAQLAGRRRGPDCGPDRRVPRRNSFEESDARAKPWSKIGDGSVLQGIIHKEALIDTAEALRHKLWQDYPRAEARSRRREREQLSSELERLNSLEPAKVPVGAPATLRIQIAEHDEWLAVSDGRLRRIDVDVLRGLLSYLTDFVTGALFPSEEAIAAAAGVHKNSVIEAKRRLRAHGLIDWVRRTTRTGNDGERGPQLEQTSNAYEFAPRKRMAQRTWQTYWQRLCVKLKRLGAPRPSTAPPATTSAPAAPAAPMTLLSMAVASLGTSIANANT